MINSNMIAIICISAVVAGSALYVGYIYKRPESNSGIFEGSRTSAMSSRELLDDIGVSRHRGGTRTNRKSKSKSHRR